VVWTGLSSGQPQPGAVAVKGGRILAVGDAAVVSRYVGGETQVLSARGGLIMPGFADGHTHFIDGGFQLVSVDLRDAATPQEFIRRLKTYAQKLKPGEWITGGDWDHTLWKGAPSSGTPPWRARSPMPPRWALPRPPMCRHPGPTSRAIGGWRRPGA